MRIYVITSGEYSDYRIETVFTDKRKAEIYAATHSANIEEYEADECQVSSNTDVYVVHEFTARRGVVEPGCDIQYTTRRQESRINRSRYCYFIYVCLDERNEDKARKIAQDIFAKYKAEVFGL